jgi:parvulin-like peptidyl-prolyl isomerase
MKSLLREPLVHFLSLGALLFLYFEWSGGGAGPGSNRIVIGPGQVEHLASSFNFVWQRPPTEGELKGLLDDYVKEEIATREAMAMGLDRDDAILRRRLRQKLEFLVEDAVDAAPPSEEELQAWLDQHSEMFRAEPRVSLRQVFVNGEKPSASADAERLLARLKAAGPGADIETLGDASMLPREIPMGPVSEVSRAFGTEFAEEILELEPGVWTGPVTSPYGLHLVLVLEREEARSPELADVRPLVERELVSAKRKAQLDAMYENLLEKYAVSIEMPKEEERAAEGSR